MSTINTEFNVGQIVMVLHKTAAVVNDTAVTFDYIVPSVVRAVTATVDSDTVEDKGSSVATVLYTCKPIRSNTTSQDIANEDWINIGQPVYITNQDSVFATADEALAEIRVRLINNFLVLQSD
jgi:hypothetical protein